MKKLNIDIRRIKQHLPAILTGVSIIGVAVTAYTSYKAGEKNIEHELAEYASEGEHVYSKKDVVKNFAPMAISASVTIGAIIFNQRINSQQKAELAASVACLSGVISSYQREIRERYSKEDARDIDWSVMDHNPDMIETVESVKFTDYGSLASDNVDQGCGGDTLFYDSYCNRWFRSSMMAVTSAEYYVNRNYVNNGKAYLSDFYGYLGLAINPDDIELGWEIPSELEDDDVLWIDFEHNFVGERGAEEPFYEILYCREPKEVTGIYTI